MTGSRCLHCGAQLPVFRKFTGAGDFCSDAHRQTYQQELNRIALSRLMKARPRDEKPGVATQERESAKAAPSKLAEPPPPPVAGFIELQVAGRTASAGSIRAERPVGRLQELAYPVFTAVVATQRECAEPVTVPPLAQPLALSDCAVMCMVEPELRRNLAPAEFSAPELPFSKLFETALHTTGFDTENLLEENEDTPEEHPLRLATGRREIAVRAIEPEQPRIVRSLEPTPFEVFAPQLPTLNLLPLRAAITLANPPKPVERNAPAPAARKEPPPRPVQVAKTGVAAKQNAEARPAAKPAPVEAQPPRPRKPPPAESVRLPQEAKPRPAEVSRLTEVAPTESSRPPASTLTLGLPPEEMGSPVFRMWYSTPAKVKVAIAAGLLGIVIFSALSKNAAKPTASPTAGLVPTAPAVGLTGGDIPMGGGGWLTEWAGDAAGSKRGKQLTLYKPSMPLKDYRTEFVGQIESRSLGWVFRAKDTKNYYAMKVRIVRPGIEPEVVLTRYAVVDAIEGPAVDVPLKLTVRNDTLYRVKVEVQGATFSTYIQGKGVDIWTDNRLTSGGFGFSNERGERAHIKSVSVSF